MMKGKSFFYVLRSQIISENSPIIKDTWEHMTEWPLKHVSLQYIYSLMLQDSKWMPDIFFHFPEASIFYKNQCTFNVCPMCDQWLLFPKPFLLVVISFDNEWVSGCVYAWNAWHIFTMSLSVPVAQAKPNGSGGPVVSCQGRGRHAIIQTETPTKLWMPSDFCWTGPSESCWTEWVVTGVINEKETLKKRQEMVCELRLSSLHLPSYLLLIGHQAVDAVPMQ